MTALDQTRPIRSRVLWRRGFADWRGQNDGEHRSSSSSSFIINLNLLAKSSLVSISSQQRREAPKRNKPLRLSISAPAPQTELLGRNQSPVRSGHASHLSRLHVSHLSRRRKPRDPGRSALVGRGHHPDDHQAVGVERPRGHLVALRHAHRS